jgi:glycosyltransferase involved in cell wall biosynthesis
MKELKEQMPDAVFLGQLSGNDLSTAYASSDIFVFPSTTETFGNVTIEAMASGVPPICAKEGGAYGIIDDGVTGLIAKPRDPVDLSNKIIFGELSIKTYCSKFTCLPKSKAGKS